MNAKTVLPHVDPGQLVMPGMGPCAGERYRNRNTGTICAVVGIAQRHYGWVTVRMMGQEQVLRLDRFLRTFERIN